MASDTMSRRTKSTLLITSLALFLSSCRTFVMMPAVDAFAPKTSCWRHTSKMHFGAKSSSSSGGDEPILTRVSEEDEGIPIPFVDKQGNSFIECYADSVASIDGEEFTIGVPCDYCVALCYMDDDDNLVPIELNDNLMDDVFPMAENVIAEEFGEELVLQRTPQTLTLVGELDEDEDDEEDEDDDDDDDDVYDGEEEVELLLSFEHRDKEFSLVRLMDPVLLVGKSDPERPDLRVLLSPEESEKVMPRLENAFLKYHEGGSSMLP